MPQVARARIIRPCSSAISAKCFFDRVLDGANLGGDFEGGGFNHLFAHDMFSPRREVAPRRAMVSNDERERAA